MPSLFFSIHLFVADENTSIKKNEYKYHKVFIDNYGATTFLF